MKVFVVFAVYIVAAAFAGIVTHTPCGGDGQLLQVRISECSGDVAEMEPGNPYACEADVIPANASDALHLRVTALFHGLPISIIDAPIPNSAVQPDMQYVLRWTITPSDQLSGNTVPVSAEISDELSGAVVVCGTVLARVA
ncbi:uncharacterized protein LOC118437829 [Folsomia candida]|uniref:Mite group 2 allergen Lep d 2 n=1 Tax=Folsomia candida TaxID=158441 RepID=A0A226DMF6_FOLCA|nr:uncharacterized protein LOC118437829 [Folsomia candida]OXA46034.1 Mite group 2 allergen Lep d 2 [Folsomia candida]